MKFVLSADDIAHAMEVAASSADPHAAYAVVDDLAQRTIGHRLFTVMRYLAETVEVERLYSSNPSAYPPGGADGVRAAFSDHALLSQLGIGAIMNIPIRFRGQVLGTMNLSHEAGHFTSGMIAPGRILAALLVPLLLAGAPER